MERSRQKITTNVLVKAAFLTALSVVLTRFFSFILPLAVGPTIRVGFGDIPLIISGLLFGPIVGGITGTAADILGVLINPMGAFHPGFIFSSFLTGFIPGMISLYYKKNPNNGRFFTFPRIIGVEIVLGLIVATFLNTLWLSRLYGKGFLVLLPARLISIVINIPISGTIVYNILKIFKNETRV